MPPVAAAQSSSQDLLYAPIGVGQSILAAQLKTDRACSGSGLTEILIDRMGSSHYGSGHFATAIAYNLAAPVEPDNASAVMVAHTIDAETVPRN